MKKKFSEIKKRILEKNSDPHSISLGVAVGVFTAFTPLMGIQTVFLFLLFIPFRKVNKIAAYAGSWVMNYVTFLPIYIFIYRLGLFFLPGYEAIGVSELTELLRQMDFEKLLGTGLDIFIPMAVGGSIAGLAFGIFSYFLTRFFITRGCP